LGRGKVGSNSALFVQSLRSQPIEHQLSSDPKKESAGPANAGLGEVNDGHVDRHVVHSRMTPRIFVSRMNSASGIISLCF
jgi:hypothetical protein